MLHVLLTRLRLAADVWLNDDYELQIRSIGWIPGCAWLNRSNSTCYGEHCWNTVHLADFFGHALVGKEVYLSRYDKSSFTIRQ